MAMVAATLGTVPMANASEEQRHQKTTKEYLDEANELLLRGKYRDAIKSFGTAIERDPQNYLSYFKRATTLLSINKHGSALRDFSKAIELKPDFEQAFYQRAQVYLKEGNFDLAGSDLTKISSKSKNLAAKSKELKEKIALTRKTDEMASSALASNKYSDCIQAADKVVRVAPLYTSVLKVRAACKAADGDLEGASVDLGKVVRIHGGDLETQNVLAEMHFLGLNERERGMGHIRACLKSDPDNKKCKSTYTRLRSLDRKLSKLEKEKSRSKWNACNRMVAPVRGKGGLLADVDDMYAEFVLAAMIPATTASRLANYLAGIVCEGYTNTKKWDNVVKYCERTLEGDSSDVDALGRLLDAQLEMDQLDPAQITLGKLEQAVMSNGGGQHQQQLHQRKMKLEQKKRMAARKDYYKILDVARDATQAEIKKAFRMLAHKWHPDRYRGDLPKEDVEMKMADLNQAYEVLSNEETRTQYDQGHDPNDPTSGGPGGDGFGGNPFMFYQGDSKPMFFQQGGGSGKQFSFQFGGPGGGFPF